MATLTLRLPQPYPAQAAIQAHPAKRKVVCAGRRVGKTTQAAATGVARALAGRQVLFASPTQEQVDVFWDKCKRWLHPLIAAGVCAKNETRRVLTFAGGGRIRAKTAWDADSLRGDYADFLVLDECALLAPSAWQEVGAPMLADNDGDAWFLSTPRRRNWFYGLYQRAVTDATGRWAAFHLTSLDNPYLSAEALAGLIGDMPDDAYRQEILAEFLEGEGAVFRNISANLTAPVCAPADHHGHRLVMGVDWGQQHDYTVLDVGCATCAQEVAWDRFNQVGWAVQRDRLMTLARTWGVATIIAESNSIGGPNIEALAGDGMPILGFPMTAASKPPLIQSLALALEREEAAWLDWPVATAELSAYEARVSAATGRSSYSAPEGMHDDTVIARALMWHGVLHSSTGVFF